MYLADLHVHSSVSDCSTDAESILKEAKDAGVTHLEIGRASCGERV